MNIVNLNAGLVDLSISNVERESDYSMSHIRTLTSDATTSIHHETTRMTLTELLQKKH